MIKKKLLEAFNDQLNASMNSSFLYLAMSSYFEEVELHGFANWMRLQTTKEIEGGWRGPRLGVVQNVVLLPEFHQNRLFSEKNG